MNTLLRSAHIKTTCCLLFIAGISIHAHAQKNIQATVDNIVGKAMEVGSYPGVAVAVIQNGRVVVEKTYGVKSMTTKVPVDTNTVFSIGSVSKAFTAIGLMKLEQEGKLSLDDVIGKYMKDLPAKWQSITIRQYMTHTSGIPQLKGDKDNGSFEQTVKDAAKLPMQFETDKKQVYNNFNFAIIGKLIEAISGSSYMDYMNENIFKPLQMQSTGVKPATTNMAMGHMLKNGKWQTIETHFKAGDYGVSSGGLQTSLSDFIRLSNALYNNAILNKKTTKLMWTPYSNTLTNTPGWHSRMAGKTLVIHKGGGGTGIGCVCDYKIIPSQNIYIIVMINKAGNDDSPSTLSDDILLQCFGIQKDTGNNDGEGSER